MLKSDSSSAQIQETLAFLQQGAKQALVASLSAMLGDESLRAEDVSKAQATDKLLWFEQEYLLPDSAAMFLGLEQAAALAIGHKLLAASGLEGEDDPTAMGTFQEVLGQVGGAFASAFTARLKKDVPAGKLSQKAPESPVTNAIFLRLKTASDDLGVVTVFPTLELINGLVGPRVEEPSKEVTPPPPAGLPAVSGNVRNLDLLLDVEMPVSVSFGRAQLPLKEVIKLTTGSIVELDRTVSEPVEIIVNNAVIAQGEVVVVDGNFGVRITQILSKQDRLRSLG